MQVPPSCSHVLTAFAFATLARQLPAQSVPVSTDEIIPIEIADESSGGIAGSKLFEAIDAFYRSGWTSAEVQEQFADIQDDTKSDLGIPEEDRVEAAALAIHLLGRGADDPSPFMPSEQWGAIERELIAAFPRQESGYIGLLCAAENEADPELSTRWAREILTAEHAPDWARDRADHLLMRNDLAGLALHALVGDLWPEASAATGGFRSVVIYTWTADRFDELASLANDLSRYETEGELTLFGVCIDDIPLSSQELAAPLDLAGDQLYIVTDSDRLAVGRLHMNLPFLAYRADSDGIVRSVTRLAASPESSR